MSNHAKLAAALIQIQAWKINQEENNSLDFQLINIIETLIQIELSRMAWENRGIEYEKANDGVDYIDE